jgi:hypothetical protein
MCCPNLVEEQMSRPFNPAAALPLRIVRRGPRDHVFWERPMALDLMVEHLAQISHVHHLPTSGTRIEMIALVFRFAALPTTDNLTRLDH